MLSLKFPAIDPKTKRIVLLGVGNELHADDAAGLLVIRALRTRLDSSPVVLLLEGEIAPENFTGKIRQSVLDVMIFLDAAQDDGLLGVIPIVALAIA